MSRKKILALLISLCLLFTAGCGLVDTLAEEIEAGLDRVQSAADMLSGALNTTGGDGTHFSEMLYVRCDEEKFMDLCREVEAFAKDGADLEGAAEKAAELYGELCYVHTMASLAELNYYRDPTAPGAEEEMGWSLDLYYRLYDEYMYAIGALAASDNAHVLEDEFYTDTIDYIAEVYGVRPEGDTGEELQLYSRETELIQEYYSVMGEEFPDEKAAAEIFVELVKLRQEEAALYGYDSYADYSYYDYYCKDYSPDEAQAVWAGVKEHFAPIIREHYDRLGYAADRVTLRCHVDCSPEAILDAMDRTLPRISSELHSAFRYMVDKGLYDIAPSPEKADIGYTVRLYYYGVPFIFNCACGEFYDYLDMIHEFGHFANTYYTWSDLIFGYSDNDLAELQSQGLEMIYTAYFEDIFGSSAEDVEEYLLLDMLCSIVDGAMYDEFQQKVYAEDALTADKVCEIYAGLYEDYGYEPYEGYEYEWIYVPHNFEYPFYYISYAVSALSALELHALMQTDPEAAVEKYLLISSMDTEYYYYSEALEEAGLSDVFDSELYSLLAEDILKALE